MDLSSNGLGLREKSSSTPHVTPCLSILFLDDEQTEYAMSEILRFITGLRVRLILSSEESKSLEELLFENRYPCTMTTIAACELTKIIKNIRSFDDALTETDLNSSSIHHLCNMWYLQHPSICSLFSGCERF
jgi:hypothetical protein